MEPVRILGLCLVAHMLPGLIASKICPDEQRALRHRQHSHMVKSASGPNAPRAHAADRFDRRRIMLVIGQNIGQEKAATIAAVPMRPQPMPPYVARALRVRSL
jgi:hypothetical protein